MGMYSLVIAIGVYATLMKSNPFALVYTPQEAGELDGYPALLRLVVAVFVSLFCSKQRYLIGVPLVCLAIANAFLDVMPDFWAFGIICVIAQGSQQIGKANSSTTRSYISPPSTPASTPAATPTGTPPSVAQLPATPVQRKVGGVVNRGNRVKTPAKTAATPVRVASPTQTPQKYAANGATSSAAASPGRSDVVRAARQTAMEEQARRTRERIEMLKNRKKN